MASGCRGASDVPITWDFVPQFGEDLVTSERASLLCLMSNESRVSKKQINKDLSYLWYDQKQKQSNC
jgi:hypothetical protein